MNVTKKFGTRRGKKRLLYDDGDGVMLNGTLTEPQYFYIDTFENKSGVKGRGKRLLCYVINDIMQNHPDVTFIQLNSTPESQEPFSSQAFANQQLRLNKYYEGLGFVLFDSEVNDFVGDVATVHRNACG